MHETARGTTLKGVAGEDPLAVHSRSPRELKAILAAERSGRPFIALRDPQSGLRIIELDPQRPTVTLGRGPETDVSVGWDREVSGLHAELQRVAGEWTILDDGLSLNGTFVNGQRVNGRQRLRDGDRFTVGITTVAFVEVQRDSAGSTVPASALPAVPELSEMQRRVLVALCRPFRDGANFATAATNQEIAEEVFLSVPAVKMHLRALFLKFGVGELAQNQKRASLVECALQSGVISPHELQ